MGAEERDRIAASMWDTMQFCDDHLARWQRYLNRGERSVSQRTHALVCIDRLMRLRKDVADELSQRHVEGLLLSEAPAGV